ncbi:MAG: DNA polymerase I, partial [Bacteroidales bacterium]|nr:DNA polymerase I [Bacteroidales bacterium]
MATQKRLYLLDAYALIYRAYYALNRNPRINSKGLNTSAILGFANTLLEVLESEKPDYLAVVFDPRGKTFRSDFFPAYKANREKTPEDITLAVPYIKSLIEGFGVEIIEVANFEADDVIGTLAKKAEKEDLQVIMMTPDK